MPAPQPLSQVTWPMVLSTACAYLPPVAAAWARRYRRGDLAGQVAVCWAVMAVVGTLQILRVMGYLPASLRLGYLATIMFPLLLVSPSLAWIGPRARRWRWPVLAGWALLCAVALATFDTAREFRAVMSPLMALVMTTLSGMALAARVPHAADGGVRRQDWFWILTAHVVYFASDILRQPLSEALVARHFHAVAYVADGLMLLYAAVYLMLVRGMLLRRPVPGAPPPPVPPSATGAPARAARQPELV